MAVVNSTQAVIDRYLSHRDGSNIWARHPGNIKAWRDGRLERVRAISLEFAPILDCNANCPLCPYAASRRGAGLDLVLSGKFAPPNGISVATPEIARRVLDKSRTAGIEGVLWTGGGEPTIWEPLVEMCRYSRRLGMTNAVYTNGFMLAVHPTFAEDLMHPETGLAFLRISFNAISPDAVKSHWGLDDPQVVDLQIEGLKRLLSARERFWAEYRNQGVSPPSLPISTIIDHKNVGDLQLICETVADVYRQFPDCRAAEDVMVVRPLVDHRYDLYADHDHDERVIESILDVCGQIGPGRRIVEDADLDLHLGFGLDQVQRGEVDTYGELVRGEFRSRSVAWAHGLFLTVGPDGRCYPCTEMNCDPEWAIGNLLEQSVEEIWESDERREFLRLAQSVHWGPQLFQPHSRSARLDRIAGDIMTGRVGQDEIDRIAELSKTGHSLLLN